MDSKTAPRVDRESTVSPPLVSVVMSAWNEEKYISKTVESILNQTFTSFEFIIVNDGSTDKTQQLLEDFASRDKRIRIIVNEVNMYIARSLNRGIESAQGEYVAIIDAADMAHPMRLERQVRFLQDRKDVYVVGSYVYWINEDGKTIGEWKVPEVIETSRLYLPQIAVHPSVMIRRELFDKIGFYDTNSDVSVEFELYLRVARHGFGIANIPEFLTYVTLRDKGVTHTNLRKIQLDQFRIKLRYLPHFFSFWNVLSTLRSFVGFLLPNFLLKRVVRRSIGGDLPLKNQSR